MSGLQEYGIYDRLYLGENIEKWHTLKSFQYVKICEMDGLGG